jgi:hypothetical protein
MNGFLRQHLHIYVNTYIFTSTPTYLQHLHIYVNTYIFTSTPTYLHRHLHIYVNTYIFTSTPTYLRQRLHIYNTYIFTSTPTYLHQQLHIYIDTYIFTSTLTYLRQHLHILIDNRYGRNCTIQKPTKFIVAKNSEFIILWRSNGTIGKVDSAHAIKAYRGSRGIAPLIPIFGSRGRWVDEAAVTFWNLKSVHNFLCVFLLT